MAESEQDRADRAEGVEDKRVADAAGIEGERVDLAEGVEDRRSDRASALENKRVDRADILEDQRIAHAEELEDERIERARDVEHARAARATDVAILARRKSRWAMLVAMLAAAVALMAMGYVLILSIEVARNAHATELNAKRVECLSSTSKTSPERCPQEK